MNRVGRPTNRNDYTIEHAGDGHVRIRRHDGAPIRCGWDFLQIFKNEALGEEACAVEVFPPQSELVDEENIRHLWLVDTDTVPSLLSRT